MKILISGNGSGLRKQIKTILEHRDDFTIELPKHSWEEPGRIVMLDKQLESPYKEEKHLRMEKYTKMENYKRSRKGK